MRTATPGMSFFSPTKDMLEHVADFVESREYFSWEQFFTDYLIEISKDSFLKYSKRRLRKLFTERNQKTDSPIYKWNCFEELKVR